MAQLSSQTLCQNELGEVGGPSKEETRWEFLSQIPAVLLDAYSQHLQSAWKSVLTPEPLLIFQWSEGLEVITKGGGQCESVH